MRWLPVMLALGACNQVFGINPTIALPPIDAQQFDAPRDAPYACPPFGQQPAFSPFFHQIVATGNCTEYTRSTEAADLAIASCTSDIPVTITRIEQGPIDMELAFTTLVQNGGPWLFGSAVLAPDGDQLWINRSDAAGVATISVYDRTPPTSWTWAYDAYKLPAVDAGATLSPPMRAGPGRRILYQASGVHELVENSPGAWSEVHFYRTSAFSMSSLKDVSLSADGLRMVASGITLGPGSGVAAIIFAARASVNDLFGAATVLEGTPSGGEAPFMTEDCGRLYFSGLGSVFYINQR